MGTNKTRKIIHYFPSSDKLLLNSNGLQLVALLFLLPQPRVSQRPRINPLMKGKRMSQVSFLPSNGTDEWYKYTMSWVIRMLCHHSSMGQHTKGFQFSDNRDGHHIPSCQSPPKEQSRDSEKPLFLSPSLLPSLSPFSLNSFFPSLPTSLIQMRVHDLEELCDLYICLYWSVS